MKTKVRRWRGMKYVATDQAVFLAWPNGWSVIFMWN